jgi:heat shock transcription factor
VANVLRSFLDDNKNTNLIRWSDDGNSFIVVDEDEFARTLIPELFKHNNYASFVRQLNMYGFHKKVGLSDNSMKASETKSKAPSEYFNKYFKRGRPELLWLIQKPKNPTTGGPKRKRDDDGKQGDSDEDRKYAPDTGGGGNYAEDGLTLRENQEMAMIPRTEYNSLRTEVRALQQQQKVISNVLSQIRRQNDQLYQQATAFQSLHDRHENSINAILTFLATFYNRTLEGNNGASLADMFGPAIPQPQQQHGSVVDVGDYPEKSMRKSPQLHRQQKRPLALLPAPAPKEALLHTDRATTLTPTVRSAATTPGAKPSSRPQNVFSSPGMQGKATQGPIGLGNQAVSSGMSNIPLKVENPSTPQIPSPLPENDEIMSAIQTINANANANQNSTQGPQFDFPSALANYQAQDNGPLTQQQRQDVLSHMINSATAASPNSVLATNANNAMVNPQPPAMPDLSQFNATQQQLDILQKMSEEQNARVHNLHERLQPLSPSGTIPGMADTSYFGTVGEPGAYDLDLDSFVQGDDYFPQTAPNGTATGGDVSLPDLNFDLPDAGAEMNGAGFDGTGVEGDFLGVNGGDGGGRVESVSSSAASPAVTVEDVEEDRPKRSPKRMRKK